MDSDEFVDQNFSKLRRRKRMHFLSCKHEITLLSGLTGDLIHPFPLSLPVVFISSEMSEDKHGLFFTVNALNHTDLEQKKNPWHSFKMASLSRLSHICKTKYDEVSSLLKLTFSNTLCMDSEADTAI